MRALWDQLDTEGAVGSGYVRLRILEIESCAAYVARRLGDGSEALVFEIATKSIPSRAKYPVSAGFLVAPEVLEAGRDGKTRLVLVLTEPRFRDVFHALAEDILTSLVDCQSESGACEALLSRLARWQAFLRKHGAKGMSAVERRGLYGELSFLNEKLLDRCTTTEAVGSWVGCRGANHDFQLPAGCVEVKTTRASTPHAFHVSNIRQLADDAVPVLYLHLLTVEESEAGSTSLPELVEAIRESLSGSAREEFEDSLVEAGYLSEHEANYQSPRYSVRAARFFEVRDGFPRLLEEGLPVGVEEVKYQVAVAACSPYECQETAVFDSLLGGLNEH